MSISRGRTLGTDKVIVIGAGIGGLAAAAELAAHGAAVTLVDRAAAVGGKMRRLDVAGRLVDGGPTVFTMKWVFDALFEAAGASFDDAVSARRLSVISRNAWGPGEVLDLFSDPAAAADAIGDFAGTKDRAGYLRFCADTAAMFRAAEGPFLESERSTPMLFASREGIATLAKLKALDTMWHALGGYFHDPRLRQLFGRYATYVGASPFETTATMMLIAHVEHRGCWTVAGGIYAIAQALRDLAVRHGAEVKLGTAVEEILVRGGAVSGVRLSTGETLQANAVVCNSDISAFAAGLFGAGVANAVAPIRPRQRTLSGLTVAMLGRPEGLPPARHTVFFSGDYRGEFRDLFDRRRLPTEPTVYLCAQDREDPAAGVDGTADAADDGADERFLAVINAPANADTSTTPTAEIEECRTRAFALMERCGLTLRTSPDRMVVTTPDGFASLFPASGGALYGKAMHGWAAAAGRPASRTKVAGLYIVGAGAHPGPGVPMVALSGRKATAAILSDFASRERSRPVATSGGMSMR